MADEAGRPRLGRGLAALIGDLGDPGQAPAQNLPQRKVAVEFLRPNPRNPRRRIGEEELAELAASIRMRGIIQPIVVRPLKDVPGVFEIVAGERRWRAAERVGLDEVPVVVVEIDERASLEFAILENIQRADLNAIEEAAGYDRLMREFRYSPRELAEILGKSRSHLANTLRLLDLPPALQERLAAGEITAGHGRALLSVRDPDGVARRIVAEGLSVRAVEAIAAEEARTTPAPRSGGRPRAERPVALRGIEQALSGALGLAVALKATSAEAGEVRIRYGSAEELAALCRKFDVAP